MQDQISKHLYKKNGKKSIIGFGSSYSASLLLLIAKNDARVKSLILFSPGEYLRKIHLSEEVIGFSKPLYVTSARKERNDIDLLIKMIDKKYVTHFVPTEEGQHGARALWKKSKGYEFYWKSLERFLLG